MTSTTLFSKWTTPVKIEISLLMPISGYEKIESFKKLQKTSDFQSSNSMVEMHFFISDLITWIYHVVFIWLQGLAMAVLSKRMPYFTIYLRLIFAQS